MKTTDPECDRTQPIPVETLAEVSNAYAEQWREQQSSPNRPTRNIRPPTEPKP